MSIAKGIVSPIFKQNLVSSIVRSILNIDETLFTPLDLFLNGEQGVWYDPSDLTTLYQDAAGTTPVTADGDPVGRMEDKSGNGNHATQSVAASRPVYQRGDSRGVVNLLKWSEALDNAAWDKDASSITIDTETSPDGSVTADTLVNDPTGNHRVRQTVPTKAGESYTLTIHVKRGNDSIVQLSKFTSTFTDFVGVEYNFDTDQVTGGVRTLLGDGWVRLALTATTTTNSTMFMVRAGAANGTDNGTVHLWGAQLEQGTTATPYQRNDSHLGGVATGSADDLHWLAFDGVDDYMFTGSNFGVSFTSSIFASAAFINNNVNTDFSTIFAQATGVGSSNTRKSFSLMIGDRYADGGLARVSTDVWQPAGAYGDVNIVSEQASVASWVISDWSQHFSSGASFYLDGQAQSVSIFSPSSTPLSPMNNAPLYIGQFGPSLSTSFLTGNFYGGVIIRDAVKDDTDRTNLEAYLSTKSGVVL